MAFSLIPDREVSDIEKIDTEFLVGQGIRLVLADLDNTLVPYGVAEPTEAVRRWKAALERGGITLFILSNSRRPHRARRFAEALDVPFLGHAGKPGAASFHKAMAQMGCTPAETIMVGDQLFTDVLGAKNAGVSAVAVHPIRFGNPFRAIRYGVEIPFRAIGRRRARHG